MNSPPPRPKPPKDGCNSGEKKTGEEKSHKGIWWSECPGSVPGINSDAAFLLTVGSFLLTVELFYLQLIILALLLAVGAFLLTILAFLLTVFAFLLTVGKCF